MHHKDVGHDWNEGEPDHEGEMATSQLHRVAEMAEMLLGVVGENDELPGWVQYKLGRIYNDMNDVFGFMESESHDLHNGDLAFGEEGMMSTDIESPPMEEGKKGLWHNIHKRRKAGKRPKRPGQKGYPDPKAWKKLTK